MCRRECLSGDKCEHIRYCKSSAVIVLAHYREWKSKRGEQDGKRVARTPIGG
jgi:hypothetical protein